MRKKYNRQAFYKRFICQFAEAADPSSGEPEGEEGGGEQTFDPKVAVEGLQATLAALQKDMGSTKKHAGEIASLKKMVGDLTESIKSLKAGPQPDDDEDEEEDDEPEVTPVTKQRGRPKKVVAQADDSKTGDTGSEAAMAALQKQIKDLQSQVNVARDETSTERTARIAAETKQRNLERDRSILDTATTIGLADDVDPKHVIRHFKDDCKFDADADEWVYVDGDEEIPLADAVKKHLPKYMQKPKTRQGGSGQGSPGSPNGPSKAQLKINAVDLGVKARANGGRSMSQYNAAKKAFVEAGGDVTEIIDAVSSGA